MRKDNNDKETKKKSTGWLWTGFISGFCPHKPPTLGGERTKEGKIMDSEERLFRKIGKGKGKKRVRVSNAFAKKYGW